MTVRAAVVGDPIEHSLSPRIFTFLGKRLNRAIDYRALRIARSQLVEAVDAARAGGWIGWNVTIPHKEAIVPLLDSLDVAARDIGAVNVVCFRQSQRIGYNTDAEGFAAPLKRSGLSIRGKRAVILGGGGASKAVVAALQSMNTGGIEVLARRLGNWTPQAVSKAVQEADLVVQATPLGMDGRSSPLTSDQPWKKGALAYDLVYRPIETPFLRQAKSAGAAALSGAEMLAAQAAETWRIWFGETVPEPALRAVEDDLRKALQ